MEWTLADWAHVAEAISAVAAAGTLFWTIWHACKKWNEYRDVMLENHALEMYVKLKELSIKSPNICDGVNMNPSQYWGYEALFMSTCESLYMSFKDKGKDHPWVVTVSHLLASRQAVIDNYLGKNPAWEAEFDQEFVVFMKKTLPSSRSFSAQRSAAE